MSRPKTGAAPRGGPRAPERRRRAPGLPTADAAWTLALALALCLSLSMTAGCSRSPTRPPATQAWARR